MTRRGSLWFGVAALGAIVLFSSLGFWQLRRAEEKQALQSEYDRRADEPVLSIGATRESAEALQFYRVEARGSYEAAYQVLLDNRMHQGMPGYHVVTPLRVAGGNTRVLVNRGWMAAGTDRAHLPDIKIPTGPVLVRGIAMVPSVGFVPGKLPPLSPERPTVWTQFDLKRYAEEVPFPIQPVVVLLDSASMAGGYARDWARLDTGIAVHHGYAFQWFALAAASFVLYLVLTVRALRRRSTS